MTSHELLGLYRGAEGHIICGPCDRCGNKDHCPSLEGEDDYLDMGVALLRESLGTDTVEEVSRAE